MMRRNAQVCQQGINLTYLLMITHKVIQIPEITSYKRKMRIIRDVLLGICILIKAIQTSVISQAAQNFTRVSSASKGNVYIDAIRTNSHAFQTFLQQHRHMINHLLLLHFGSFSMLKLYFSKSAYLFDL